MWSQIVGLAFSCLNVSIQACEVAQLKVKALVPHDWWLEFNLRDSQWKVRATSQSCPLAVGASVLTCTRACARTHTYTNAGFHKCEFPLEHFYYVSPVLVCMIPNVLCGNIHSHVFSAVNFPCSRFPVSSYWGSEMVFSMIFIMINLPRIVEYRIFLVPWSFYIKIWSIHVKTHKKLCSLYISIFPRLQGSVTNYTFTHRVPVDELCKDCVTHFHLSFKS